MPTDMVPDSRVPRDRRANSLGYLCYSNSGDYHLEVSPRVAAVSFESGYGHVHSKLPQLEHYFCLGGL